jgi:5-keto-L-gluconate epimerase
LRAQLDAVIIIGLLRGITRPGVDFGQAWRWVANALRECCDEAGRRGVRIALEPVNRYETSLVNNVAEGLALIAEVTAPNLGLLFDTFHANIEEPSIEASIAAAAGRLYHVHVADSNRWHPGAGHLDFARLLDAFRATGYAGFVSGEFMPLPDADAAAVRGLRHLRAIHA